MIDLFIFNIVLILIIVAVLIVFRKTCKSDRSKYIVLLSISIGTILCHYSSLLYHQIVDNSAMDFLKSNPNLILPIYPCNVVMWLSFVYGIIKNKQNKFTLFLGDYIFWFGIASALVGMFVNIDYFREPTLLNYDVTKGIVAHAIMLLNVLALPVLGFTKIKLERNIIHILISIVMMYLIGQYCNLVFTVIGSDKMAYDVNSMFIIHSPFEGVNFLTYPIITSIAFIIYFGVFFILEFIMYKKGNRWYNRLHDLCKKSRMKKAN